MSMRISVSPGRGWTSRCGSSDRSLVVTTPLGLVAISWYKEGSGVPLDTQLNDSRNGRSTPLIVTLGSFQLSNRRQNTIDHGSCADEIAVREADDAGSSNAQPLNIACASKSDVV